MDDATEHVPAALPLPIGYVAVQELAEAVRLAAVRNSAKDALAFATAAALITRAVQESLNT